MRSLKLFSFVLIAATSGLTACDWFENEWDPEEKIFFLQANRVDCDEEEIDSEICYVYTDEDVTNETLEVPIQGFNDSDYEWGYEYQLRVEEQREGDGSRRTLTLLETISRDYQQSERFSVQFENSNQYLSLVAGDTYRLYDEFDFTCDRSLPPVVEGDPTPCDQLDNAVNLGNQETRLTIVFAATEGEPARLDSICVASEDNFARLCDGVRDAALIIDHYKVDCEAPEPALCFRYKVSDDSDFSLLRVGIPGFEYTAGFEHSIDATVTQPNNGEITNVVFNEIRDEAVDRAEDIDGGRDEDKFTLDLRVEEGGLIYLEDNIFQYPESGEGTDIITFECSGDCDAGELNSDYLEELYDEDNNKEGDVRVRLYYRSNGDGTYDLVSRDELLCTDPDASNTNDNTTDDNSSDDSSDDNSDDTSDGDGDDDITSDEGFSNDNCDAS